MGQDLTLTCSVPDGDLPIDIQWYFNGHAIMDTDDISMMKVGKRTNVLSIESVRAQHAGVFICQAKNGAGKAQHSTELSVYGDDNE